MEAANLPTFLKFGNAKKSDICVIFAKIMGGHETGDLEQKWGRLCPPSPGLKPPLLPIRRVTF